MAFDSIRQEFWGDVQVDLFTKNTAYYLANRSMEQIVSDQGYKVHRPIISQPQTGTYTPHVDISFESKSSTDQTLTVDTFEYSAEDIDITESKQTPYDLLKQSTDSIRRGLMNRVEQKFMDQISSARHTISGGTQEVNSTNILDIIEEAEGILGAYDAPYESSERAIVLGPRTVAKLRRAKGERETSLGDQVLMNGVVGPWNGWTVVQNNNLPWSATLTIATQPTDGDTVTIAGVVFTFKTTLGSTAGNVLIGASATTARANLEAAIEGGAGAGTTYVEIGIRDKFMLRKKRYVRCTSTQAMAFTGYGDIAVSETLTAAADVWSAQKQTPIFMVRGSIDLLVQFMSLDVGDKEKGFAKLPKALIGIGAKVFEDGADLMVKLNQDASNF